MLFLELTVTGAPGTHGTLRFPLEPGLHLWAEKGFFRGAAVTDLLADLLYPPPMATGVLGPGKIGQAELKFESRGSVYQVVRDYVAGTTSLAVRGPGSSDAFKEMSRDLRFVAETLLRVTLLPPKRVFGSLFVSSLSRCCGGDRREGRAMPSPQRGTERLPEELRGELATHKNVTDLNSELDRLQSVISQAEERLSRLEEPRKALSALEHDYREFEVFDRPGVLDPAVVPALEAYSSMAQKKKEALTALDEKKVALDAAWSALSARPSWREPLFVGGALLTPAAFTAIGFARGAGWLALLCWVGFFAGLVLLLLGFLKGRARLERREALSREMRGSEFERAAIAKRFEAQTAVCRKFFSEVGNEDPEELLTMLRKRERLSGEIVKARDDWRRVCEEVSEPETLEQRNRAREEVARIERELAELPPVTADPLSIERELARLESPSAPEGDAKEKPAALVGGEPDRLLSEAARWLERTEKELLEIAGKGFERNLAAISGRRFDRIGLNEGRISAFGRPDGSWVSWESASADEKPTLLFSVQFTLWQVMRGLRGPYPVILDVASGSPPPGELLRKPSLEAARFLGKVSQVLVLGGGSFQSAPALP